MQILHVCPVMFEKMQEAALKADFYGTDPAVLAVGQTGIDPELFVRAETRVVVDLDTPEDRPDGVSRLEPA
jgi:hypothetical protein